MVETDVADGVLRVRVPGTRWLSTGHDGGVCDADAAYNLSVPEGFDREDLAAYVRQRRERAGFPEAGPALLTGVSMAHARGARAGSVTVVATAGLSNPATLPLDAGDGGGGDPDPTGGTVADRDGHRGPPGTVNLLVRTGRSLTDGGLASLLVSAVEAKTATLQRATGFSGTTSDGVVVGCERGGEAGDAEDRTPDAYAGSVTDVGSAARACVRDALAASLRSRYPDGGYPDSVAAAEHGVETGRTATVFQVE